LAKEIYRFERKRNKHRFILRSVLPKISLHICMLPTEAAQPSEDFSGKLRRFF
jgi:hypothetical protein